MIRTIQLRFKKQHVNRPLLLDLDKLRSDQFPQQYQLEIDNRFKELQRMSETRTPNEMWQQLKETTLNVAKETIQKDFIRHKSWITDDTFKLIKMKCEAKTKSPDQYRKLRKVQKSLWRDKQTKLDALCSELEENAQKSNSRPVFQTVKKLIKPFQPHTVAIRDSTGKKRAKGGKTL